MRFGSEVGLDADREEGSDGGPVVEAGVALVPPQAARRSIEANASDNSPIDFMLRVRTTTTSVLVHPSVLVIRYIR